MGANSLPKTVTRQRCDCDLNPGPSATESSTLTTRLPSHPLVGTAIVGRYERSVCKVELARLLAAVTVRSTRRRRERRRFVIDARAAAAAPSTQETAAPPAAGDGLA